MNPIGRATRSFYDRYSYDFETSEHASMQLDASLLGQAVARVREGDLVLDAGCGLGGSAIWLARSRGARVVGINIVTDHVQRATRAAGDAARFCARPPRLHLLLSVRRPCGPRAGRSRP